MAAPNTQEPAYRLYVTPQQDGPSRDINILSPSDTVPRSPSLASRTKRCFDVIMAATGLGLGLPLLVLMALAIRLESRGNPFFIQTRVGQHGRLFRLIKMRSLYINQFGIWVDEELSLHSPRITRVGRLLRRTKLDELPQLINVVRGDMSLVGPRPIIPEQVARFTASQRGHLRVRPGLTGASQICGNTALDWHLRLVIDRWYAQRWDWALDLRILALTGVSIVAGEAQTHNRLGLPPRLFAPNLQTRAAKTSMPSSTPPTQVEISS